MKGNTFNSDLLPEMTNKHTHCCLSVSGRSWNTAITHTLIYIQHNTTQQQKNHDTTVHTVSCLHQILCYITYIVTVLFIMLSVWHANNNRTEREWDREWVSETVLWRFIWVESAPLCVWRIRWMGFCNYLFGEQRAARAFTLSPLKPKNRRTARPHCMFPCDRRTHHWVSDTLPHT